MRPISIPGGDDPAALLQVDRRLRALARALVRDPGEAEDVVQETWLAALEAGEIHCLPSWVASVVRRVALDGRRGSRRRERREKDAAQPEALPAAAEILEREEARRRLVEALLLLEEPLRATLILRFLEELPPRAVAARMDVPVETVRSRTRRGLAVLRERLDRSFGDRTSWCSALLFVLRRPSAAEVLSTALAVMSIPKKVALVVLVCTLGWLVWTRQERDVERVAAITASPPAELEGPPREEGATVAPAQAPAEREAALAADGERGAREPFGSLRVHVTWFDGTPAEGIAIHTQRDVHENPELGRCDESTDREGIALFPHLSAGRTSVALDRGVFSPATIEAGKEAALELVIPRGIDVLGRVEDTEGAAISGAEVWFASWGVLLDGTLAARSGSDGGFQLRSLRSSDRLAACAAGYRPSTTEFVSGEEGSEVTVRLVLWRGAGEVTGRIVDGLTGQPVPGAFVGVGPWAGMESEAEGRALRMDPWARTAHTDEDGRYRFTGVALGPCSIVARTQGYSLARAEVEVGEAGSENVDLALLAESSLEGHVLDETGHPVGGVSVTVGHGLVWLQAVDETSADGSFHVGALEANALLEARVYGKRGECIASTEFPTLPGQAFVWEARLGQRGTIHGRVLDEGGEPLVDWIVELDSEDSGALTRTGPDGSFRLENLDQRSHRLGARALDSLFSSLERTVRPSEDEIVLRVPRERRSSVRIVGVLLDEQGRPIPGAEVSVGTGNYSTPARIDEATGAFSYGPSPPGKWRVYAQAPRRTELLIGERELGPDQTWDCGVVRLAPEGRVVARLLFEGAELGPELWLRIRDETRIWRPEGLGGTDPLQRSAALPPGSYELVVLGGDYAAANVLFEIRSGEETHIDVPIRRGRPAIVAVTCDDPLLIEVRVSLSRAGDAQALTSTLARSSSGTFSNTYRLVPGTYRVEARAGERRVEGELVVGPEDAEPPRLELALP